MKTTKGFTLIEVLIIAVIITILAAVAIPVYDGYVSDTANAVAKNTAVSIATSIELAIAEE